MISRRSLLAMIPASLAMRLPSPSRAGEPACHTTTLDPDGPVARELDRLYQALRATHGPEYATYIGLRDCHIRYRDAGQLFNFEDGESNRAYDAHAVAQRARWIAYRSLADAIIDAAGDPELDEADWWRFGTPLAIVRVGNRRYVVSFCAHDLYDFVREVDHDHEVNVIDL
jgi:hypothetical protein